MRPNLLNEVKARQAEVEAGSEAEKTTAPTKQRARVTKLDAIKEAQKTSTDAEKTPQKSALPLSRLSKIKAKQLKETPELYAQVAEPVSTGIDSSFLEQLQAAMETDIARIKTHKKLADKQACKAELLQSYRDFVENYGANGHDYPNSVAVQLMIWQFDVGDIEPALSLGLYLVKTGNQQMPKQFNRDLQTFICDAVYDWANVQLKTDNSASPYLDSLVATVTNEKWDLHPAVISKNLVMQAKHKNRLGEFAEVVALCDLAMEANPEGAGVKTLLKSAQAKLEN